MGLIYTKMKAFHFPEKLASLPREVDQVLPPLHVRIKPTNICCHKCRYCAYGQDTLNDFGKTEVRRVSIPREKMQEIAADLIEMGVKAVTFSGGGEPLIYAHMLETLKSLAQSGIKFATLTNGSRLEGEVAEIFAARGTWVRVSMDGWDDDSYRSYRGVAAGEYTRIMTNITNFKKLPGSCYVGVSLIIDKDNGAHVYEMLRRLKDVGVDSVKLSPCLISDQASETNAYHKPFFHTVREQVERAKQDLAAPGFQLQDAYTELDGKYQKDYGWCPQLQMLPIIGADMNIYSCPDKAYNLETGLLGSIAECRFRDFWYANKEKFFKINPAVHCNHHCEANPKNQLVLEYLNADRGHLSFV